MRGIAGHERLDMETIAGLRRELHVPGQFFEPLTHAPQAVTVRHGFGAASIVACRQSNAGGAAFDRDPQIELRVLGRRER